MKKQGARNDATDEQAEVSFEKALGRLDAIVAEMEAGKTGLETMIERFEEGQKLIALCTRRLNEVERRIEILTKKGGETVAVPFDEALPDDAEQAGDGPVSQKETTELF
ncbi:MAG: exodeoxyribonuclease VII small subunit [bacterium]